MEHEFVVSALKYRPDSFDNVVGQSAITGTLKNAIRNEQLGKAFLFCGPRGVGKTTCARILAKVINCEQPTEELEPCGSCTPCKSFQEGHSLNVHELDAASNNKVEHIRELIDQVRLAPQMGSYKVYIIDEVHMLSQQAFNAFLKTLEEPPQHAIFILATTEKHKVLPTILSRCQIYDFHRIGIQDIAEHLQKVAQKEGVETEYEALHTIALKADGALRDALSIFDQLVASSQGKLSYQQVVESLNILDHEHFFKILDQLLQGDVAQAVLSFDGILQRGFDGQHFLNGLAQHIRDLLMARDERTLPLLQVGEELQQRFGEQARSCDPEKLVEALNAISDADSRYRSSKDQRLLVELTLMKLCQLLGNSEALKKKPEAAELKDEGEKEEKEGAAPEKASAESVTEVAEPEEKGKEDEEAAPPPEVESEPPPSPPPQENEERARPEGMNGAKEPQEEAEDPIAEADTAVAEAPPSPPSGSEEEAAAPPGEQEEQLDKREEKEEEAATAAPPTEARKARKFKSNRLRIQDFEQGGQEEGTETEEKSPSGERKREKFSAEDLRRSWEAFVEKLEITGAKQVLKKGPPRILEEEKLQLELRGKMEKAWVEEVKEELLNCLRKELQNDHIDLETPIEESEENGQKGYYTAKQQFDRMQEKNPKLKELRDRFDLDLDR